MSRVEAGQKIQTSSYKKNNYLNITYNMKTRMKTVVWYI